MFQTKLLICESEYENIDFSEALLNIPVFPVEPEAYSKNKQNQ